MKLLKIERNCGFFLDKDGEFKTVDKITKDDLLRLVDLTLEREEVDFDEYSDEILKNQAHQIVYKHVLEKLRDLKGRRREFMDESERLYLEEFERYRDLPAQAALQSEEPVRQS